MGQQIPDEAAVRKLIWEAFRAGMDQGSDEATAYEWGQPPRQTKDDAFADFMAEWNSESDTFRQMFPTPSGCGPIGETE